MTNAPPSDIAFWLVATFITALVAAVLMTVLLRRRALAENHSDIQIYRDQLAEIDRDLERGVIGHDEAERVRTEVSRRLLEASQKAETRPARRLAGTSPILAGLLLLALPAGTYFIYRDIGAPGYPDLPLKQRLENAAQVHDNRQSQQAAEALAPKASPPADVPARHMELMQKLREALKERPDDLQGYILLARNEAGLRNFKAAYKAQQRVIELKGKEASATDYANLADMMIQAAGGYVSPEAEAALNETLKRDEQNGVARYYLGLMHAQTGRPDLGFEMWSTLLEQSLPGAPWVAPIRSQIMELAREAGVRYRLPPEGATGPSAQDIQQAASMSPEERKAMISSMVERLSNRLADQGGSPQEWAQLLKALGVLGDKERATAIWEEAQKTFADAPDALALVRRAAKSAGVAN